MFSIIKQRTIAFYRFLKLHQVRFLAFFSVSILFLVGYLAAGVYATDTGQLSFFEPMSASAETTTTPDGSSNEPAEDGDLIHNTSKVLIRFLASVLLTVAEFFLKLAFWALSFLIMVAGYNGYINSTAVNIGWVMVRDVTNMFFVVILLLVAFGTILGLEQYEWKKMLVKFFFAAVLVNFSRTICGVIIDVGQVVMITFVNGIAATAGGNLINAFSAGEILSLSSKGATPEQLVNMNQLFIAALGALIFSAIILGMMLVFLWIIVSRLIVLWILIVLSPFAFVLSVIPQTQKYASQWWSEFGNHVVVGPVIAFFLWLSFAVVGGGQIGTEIQNASVVPDAQKNMSGEDSAGIGGTMGWDKLANFAIAIGILLVGAKTSQSLGTVGGNAMSKATDFGKKVAMIASGTAVGMWAGNKMIDAGKATGKWGLMNVPGIGGKSWEKRGRTIAAKAKSKWEDVNKYRDKKMKGWDESSKSLRELDRKKSLGMITDEEYATDKQKLIDSGKVSGGLHGSFGRLAKRVGVRMFESDIRANKRVENWEKVAESKKKVTEAETSLSSEASGQLKTAMDVEVELQEIKQKGKGETKRSEVTAARFKEDNKAFLEAQEGVDRAKEQLAAIGEGENKAAAQKELKEKEAILKAAKSATTLVGATSKVQAERATSEKETAEGRMRAEILQGDEGKKMFNKKAEAHEIHEGLRDLESLGLTRAQSHEIDHDTKDWAKKMSEVKKGLEGLRSEKDILDKKEKAGTLTEQEKITSKNLDKQILAEEKAVRKSIDKMARGAAHTNPSIFASQSRALYDHEYDLYRGKHKTAVDQAAQENIWGKYDIKAPTTAGQETIVDGIHGKVFKNMDYAQTTESVEKFVLAMQKKKENGEKIDFTDKAISQALFYQLHHGSWIDDAGQKISSTKLAEKKEDIKKIMSEVLGVTKEEISNTESRAQTNKSTSTTRRKNTPQQEGVIGKFLSSGEMKGKITTDFVARMRRGDSSLVKAFVDEHGSRVNTAIEKNKELTSHGIKNIDDLLKSLDADQDTIKKILAKLENK